MPEQGAADSTRGQHKEGARHEGATVRTSVLKKAAQTALAGGMGKQMMAKVLGLLLCLLPPCEAHSIGPAHSCKMSD